MPNWAQVRADTPAAEHVLHFNNAGSALPMQLVTKAQHDYLDLEASTGGYEALIQEAEAMEKPYTALAQLLNCHPDEIAIVTSSSTAWYQVGRCPSGRSSFWYASCHQPALASVH